jgi:hypothetical protein
MFTETLLSASEKRYWHIACLTLAIRRMSAALGLLALGSACSVLNTRLS